MKSSLSLTIFLSIVLLASSVFAVAPSEKVIQQWKADGTYDAKMAIWKSFKERGGCAPVDLLNLKDRRQSLAADANAVDTVRVIVIMVDFSDQPWTAGLQGTPAAFDSILFSDSENDSIINPTGSMTDFYMENSYGTFYVIGDIYGWYRMPQTYAYYTDGQGGLGTYPNNAQRLTYDAIQAADAAGADFSLYDYNNDFICDGVVLIHSGPGRETTGSDDDIHSHNWSLAAPENIDSVQVSYYNMNPEEYFGSPSSSLSPIGVFCHEYGHFLGLPDFYDTRTDPGDSRGLGYWSLMASGNYTGGSRSPAHMDPWCKEQVGFLTPITLTGNIYQAEIPAIEHNPVVYKLQNTTVSTDEYWLVENRQQMGFDAYLPGHGLLIYHVDETRMSNTDPTHYWVGLEQADGLDQLALSGSSGDNADPYPGFTQNHEFHEFSTPNSILYTGLESEIGVWNISNSDSLMYADLDIEYSRPYIVPAGGTPFVFDDATPGEGDGDRILEAGETISFYFTVRNDMRWGEDVYATLSSTNTGLTFTNNDIFIDLSVPFYSTVTNPSDPIKFVIPDTITPYIDSFYLTIRTDSLTGVPGTNERYEETFGFEAALGQPVILIVDDDRGAGYQDDYVQAFYEKRNPTDVWNINSSGVPALGDLSPYDMVIWHTGDTAVGSISSADINAMKQYMDNGGNLMLSTLSGIQDINSIDATFLADYFQASYNKEIRWPLLFGVDGNQITDGMDLRLVTSPFPNMRSLNIIGTGTPIFTSLDQFSPGETFICGVANEGLNYKSIVISFAAEYIDDGYAPTYKTKADLVGRIIEYFGGIATSVYDGTGFTPLPKSFILEQNYPNPFNPTTTINYTIRGTGEIGNAPRTKLVVYNLLGRKVKTLVDQTQIPGTYQVTWDGTTDNGQKVSSGIYFYRLERGKDSETKKMALLK